jgi:hypothetical protein
VASEHLHYRNRNRAPCGRDYQHRHGRNYWGWTVKFTLSINCGSIRDGNGNQIGMFRLTADKE